MYIDALKIKNTIWITDRDSDGHRRTRSYKPEYVCYYPDDDGEYTSIFDKPLAKYTDTNEWDFREALSELRDSDGIQLYESDVNPVYRLLEQLYPTDKTPQLNISVFDIEVDKDPKQGFSTIDNPYAEINANSIYNKWSDESITLLVPPENLTMQECRDLLDGKLFQNLDGSLTDICPENDTFGAMTEELGYFLVENEEQLLRLTVELWADADVVTGWNSTFFDIPYIIQRIRIVLGGESMVKLALEDGTRDHPCKPSEESLFWLHQLGRFPCPPSLRMVDHYGNPEKTYQLHGMIHMDYLDLYRKFTFSELHSYTLDAILKKEVGQEKVAYEGSLDQLYRLDFRRFAAYSRQDTMGLSAIDDKKKLVELANTMGHMAGVQLDKVLGSVALIEQALLKELHKQDKICFDRIERERDYPIPGAFVLTPRQGIYSWISSYDFNSLYPTVIRMLNISPDTIVGWVNPKDTLKSLTELMVTEGMEGAEAWAKFAGTLEYNLVITGSDEEVTFILEDGEELLMSGCDLRDEIESNNWVITAFGLVLHRDKQGIIPYCLEKWYNQRVEYKRKAKQAYQYAVSVQNEKIKSQYMDEFKYWDMLQQSQKLMLNSTYGALLNQFCRFYDPRLGASVTMSGRICLSEMVDCIEDIMEHETFDLGGMDD